MVRISTGAQDSVLIEDVRRAYENNTYSESHLGLTKPNTTSSLLESNRSFRCSSIAPFRSRLIVYPVGREPKEALGRAPGSSPDQLFPQDNMMVELEPILALDLRPAFINGSHGIFSNLQIAWSNFEKKRWDEAEGRKRRFEKYKQLRLDADRALDIMNEELEPDYDDQMEMSTHDFLEYGLKGIKSRFRDDDDDDARIRGGTIGNHLLNEPARVYSKKRKMLQLYSNAYRLELKTHIASLLSHHETLQDQLSESVDEQQLLMVEKEIETFEAMYSIWFLAEIMFMGTGGSDDVPDEELLELREPGAIGTEDDDEPATDALVDETFTSPAEDLLQWLNATQPAPSKADLLQITSSAASLIDTVIFWDSLIRCILRGLFLPAMALLNMLSTSVNARTGSATLNMDASAGSIDTVCNAIRHLLEKMPRLSTSLTPSDFNNKWRRWQTECQYHADDNYLISVMGDESEDTEEFRVARSQFQTIFLILAGNNEAISDNSISWAEAMVAMIIYTNPTATVEDFGAYLKDVRSSFDLDEEEGEYQEHYEGEEKSKTIKSLNKALTALLDLDLDGAIMFSSWIDSWLAAHLADMLDKYGRLDLFEGREPVSILSSTIYENDRYPGDDLMKPGEYVLKKLESSDPTLREWFIMEYAEPLATHPAHWQVGLEYLALGGGKTEECLARLEAHLQRIDARGTEEPHFSNLINLASVVDQRWREKLVELKRGESLQSGDRVGSQCVTVNELENDPDANWNLNTLYRVAARSKLDEKELGESMDYYVSAMEPGMAVAVSYRVLEDYCREVGDKIVEKIRADLRETFNVPPPPGTDVSMGEASFDLASQHPSVIIMDGMNSQTAQGSLHLQFLYEYRRFHRLCLEEKWREAGSVLVSIFRGRLAPKFMWAKLLYEALPLLIGPPASKTKIAPIPPSDDMVVSEKGAPKPSSLEFKGQYEPFDGPFDLQPNGEDPPIDAAGSIELMRTLEELLISPRILRYLLEPFESYKMPTHQDPSKPIPMFQSYVSYGMATFGRVLDKTPSFNPFIDEDINFPRKEEDVTEEFKKKVGGAERCKEVRRWKTELDKIRVGLVRNVARNKMLEISRASKAQRQNVPVSALEPAPVEETIPSILPIANLSPLKKSTLDGKAKSPATPSAKKKQGILKDWKIPDKTEPADGSEAFANLPPVTEPPRKGTPVIKLAFKPRNKQGLLDMVRLKATTRVVDYPRRLDYVEPEVPAQAPEGEESGYDILPPNLQDSEEEEPLSPYQIADESFTRPLPPSKAGFQADKAFFAEGDLEEDDYGVEEVYEEPSSIGSPSLKVSGWGQAARDSPKSLSGPAPSPFRNAWKPSAASQRSNMMLPPMDSMSPFPTGTTAAKRPASVFRDANVDPGASAFAFETNRSPRDPPPMSQVRPSPRVAWPTGGGAAGGGRYAVPSTGGSSRSMLPVPTSVGGSSVAASASPGTPVSGPKSGGSRGGASASGTPFSFSKYVSDPMSEVSVPPSTGGRLGGPTPDSSFAMSEISTPTPAFGRGRLMPGAMPSQLRRGPLSKVAMLKGQAGQAGPSVLGKGTGGKGKNKEDMSLD
ncbi:Nucleoporin nup85 [Phlyctochytrium bullatum]|nr:Nucleoporin nup85 [Phlyctochytrium bullatum]